MRNAAEELKYELTRYPGVFDVSDTFRSGKQEIQLQLLPEARNLGLTLNDLGSQVRNAFYGVEAQRIQRGQDDVRVMVRFPESERASVGDLENMYIRTPQGSQVPFYSVAQFEVSRGFSEIRRLDGRRVVEVSADVDRTMVTPESVMADIKAKLVTKLQEKYPTVVFDVGGEQEERNSSFISLGIGLLFSCFVIYGLLAIPLKSYLQPMVIMSVIPFGAVGAIVGHYVLDVQLMFFSALGIVALAGVVVNSSLVLVDYANRQRREGSGRICRHQQSRGGSIPTHYFDVSNHVCGADSFNDHHHACYRALFAYRNFSRLGCAICNGDHAAAGALLVHDDRGPDGAARQTGQGSKSAFRKQTSVTPGLTSAPLMGTSDPGRLRLRLPDE